MAGSTRKGQLGQSGSAQDVYDNFKRKHLAQNKDIIHKNSTLSKANADLQRELSVLRAENLGLRTSMYRLEVENGNLSARLKRAEDTDRDSESSRRLAPGVAPKVVQTIAESIHALEAPLELLRSLQALLVPLPVSPTSRSLSSTPPADSPADGASANNVSTRRRPPAARNPRPSLSTRPDLSLISEGGEASTEDIDAVQEWGGSVLEGLREEPASQPTPTHTQSSRPSRPTRSPSPRSSLPTPVLAPPRAALVRPPTTARAPPPAPSSTTNVDRRAPRRVSGLIRLPPALGVASETDEGGLPKPVAVDGDESSDLSEPESGSESGSDETGEELRQIAARAKKLTESSAAAGARASTSAVASRKAVTAAQKPPVRVVKEVEEDERAPFRELQPDVKGKGKARVVEEPAASESDSDEDPDEVYDGRLTQDPPAEDDDDEGRDDFGPARAETPPPAVRPRAPVAKFLDRGPPPGARKKPGEEPMVLGVSKERSAHRVDEMEVLREDARSRGAVAEDEEPSSQDGGRRARKSVNYALPKLNTKMRRSADYVPTIKATARVGGKKSSSAASSRPRASSTQEATPLSSSAPSTKRPSEAAKTPAARRTGEHDDDKAGEAETPVGVTLSKVARELEDQRREKALAREAAGPPAPGRRHTLAA